MNSSNPVNEEWWADYCQKKNWTLNPLETRNLVNSYLNKGEALKLLGEIFREVCRQRDKALEQMGTITIAYKPPSVNRVPQIMQRLGSKSTMLANEIEKELIGAENNILRLAIERIEARRKKVLINPDDPSLTEHFAELENELRAYIKYLS